MTSQADAAVASAVAEKRLSWILGTGALLPAGFEFAKGASGGAAWHLLLSVGWGVAACYGLFFGRITTNALIFRIRQTAGLCPDCGYDLRATRAQCPECGATR